MVGLHSEQILQSNPLSNHKHYGSTDRRPELPRSRAAPRRRPINQLRRKVSMFHFIEFSKWAVPICQYSSNVLWLLHVLRPISSHLSCPENKRMERVTDPRNPLSIGSNTKYWDFWKMGILRVAVLITRWLTFSFAAFKR